MEVGALCVMMIGVMQMQQWFAKCSVIGKMITCSAITSVAVLGQSELYFCFYAVNLFQNALRGIDHVVQWGTKTKYIHK